MQDFPGFGESDQLDRLVEDTISKSDLFIWVIKRDMAVHDSFKRTLRRIRDLLHVQEIFVVITAFDEEGKLAEVERRWAARSPERGEAEKAKIAHEYSTHRKIFYTMVSELFPSLHGREEEFVFFVDSKNALDAKQERQELPTEWVRMEEALVSKFLRHQLAMRLQQKLAQVYEPLKQCYGSLVAVLDAEAMTSDEFERKLSERRATLEGMEKRLVALEKELPGVAQERAKLEAERLTTGLFKQTQELAAELQQSDVLRDAKACAKLTANGMAVQRLVLAIQSVAIPVEHITRETASAHFERVAKLCKAAVDEEVDVFLKRTWKDTESPRILFEHAKDVSERFGSIVDNVDKLYELGISIDQIGVQAWNQKWRRESDAEKYIFGASVFAGWGFAGAGGWSVPAALSSTAAFTAVAETSVVACATVAGVFMVPVILASIGVMIGGYKGFMSLYDRFKDWELAARAEAATAGVAACAELRIRLCAALERSILASLEKMNAAWIGGVRRQVLYLMGNVYELQQTQKQLQVRAELYRKHRAELESLLQQVQHVVSGNPALDERSAVVQGKNNACMRSE